MYRDQFRKFTSSPSKEAPEGEEGDFEAYQSGPYDSVPTSKQIKTDQYNSNSFEQHERAGSRDNLKSPKN